MLAVAGIVVCPKCGHEVDSADTACGHCKAELKSAAPDGAGAEPAPVAQAGHTFLPSGTLEYLDPSVVTNEVKIGQDYLRRGQSEVGRCFFVNAAALLRLTRPPGDRAFGERILRLAEQSAVQARAVEKACPVCSGSGKMKMKVISMKGEVTWVDIADKLCPRCAGAKTIRVPGTVQDWLDRMARAGESFAKLEKGRGFVAVGDAWVPGELEGKLSTGQMATLMKATAKPCPACGGLGRADCRKCAGLGEVKCTNKDCQYGQVSVTAGGKLSDHKVIRTEECPVCSGKGVLSCDACKGEGTQLCVKCAGSGQRPGCGKCSGEGTVECRRCRGSGVDKDGNPCPTCKGEKVELCASCRGDGRRR